LKEETKNKIKYLVRKMTFKRGGDTSKSNCPYKTWDELKLNGSSHYKSGAVEPIDLYRSTKPHPSLSAFAVKALTDNIKYSYRMLTTKGVNESDCNKITHYTALALAEHFEKESGVTAAEREGMKEGRNYKLIFFRWRDKICGHNG
jgi:hypothetical protein